MDEQLVPIGRFSRATRLSIKALRHYDEIGLLTPAVVDEQTGYRYYRLGQANRAEAIRVLRDVDMPLDEIGEVLASAEQPEQVHELLKVHLQRLADELDRHRRMMAFLERLLADEETLMPYQVALESVPDRAVAVVRVHADLAIMTQQLAEAFGRISAALENTGRRPNGPPFVVFHDVIDVEQPGDIDVAISFDGEPGGSRDGVSFGHLPGGEVAVATHQGRYDQIAPAYHAITSWMTERGHEAAGPPRELYLNTPHDVEEDDLLTRVEWPVR